MITFLLGLQTAVILFLFLLGQKKNLNGHVSPFEKYKFTTQTLTDEEEHELELQKERARKINKDFQNMMSYSLEDAMKSEKVVD